MLCFYTRFSPLFLFDENGGGGGGNNTKSWREQAEEAGFTVLTKSDHQELQDGIKSLKDFRALIPEDFRGKEPDFFDVATKSITRIKEIEDGQKTELEKLQTQYDDLKKENTTLKGDLTKSQNNLTSITEERDGLHMAREMREVCASRNSVTPHPTFVTDELFAKVKRSEHDLTNEEGKKKYQDALWNEILEPALKAQSEVVRQVGGPTTSQNGSNENEGMTNQERKAAESFKGWGSQ
jgi:hypothetical protein